MLLDQAGVNRITVTLLAQKANISRNAFYDHFETLDEFYYELICDLLPVTTQTFTKETYSRFEELGDCLEFEDFYRKQERKMNEELRAHPYEMGILLNSKNYSWFMNFIGEIVSRNLPVVYDWPSSGLDAEKFEFSIIRNSAISFVQQQFRYLDRSSEEVSEEFHDFSYRSFIRICGLLKNFSWGYRF